MFFVFVLFFIEQALMLRKIHIWGLYIDVAGNIFMCLMQILKVVYSNSVCTLPTVCILDEAVINTDLQKNVVSLDRCMSKTCQRAHN